jgi:hypothetical protein
VNYAVALADRFLLSFNRLDVGVQEVILDDIDAIAERPDLATDSAGALEPSIEWHRHIGEVEGVRFDVVTWIAINPGARALTVANAFDLTGHIDW